MRRNNRTPKKVDTLNMMLYITGGIFVIALIAFGITFVAYSNKYSKEESDAKYLAQFDINETDDTASASTSIGKTIEESKEGLTNNEISNEVNTNNVVKTYQNNETKSTEETKKATTNNNVKKTSDTKENKKDPSFEKPIEGEILREFAKDNLVYSETLKEWITHYGIDIKAERATVVKAAEEGTIQSIKNDPRYGLTIIIEHNNGYKTLYANLLTTEFVTEGEKVSKGQTIATVGDSAVYEIVDESHLHFEILKNNENLNPRDYVKY